MLSMAASGLLSLLVALCLVAPSKMDTAISGKVVTKYHDPIYDSKSGLYLYSGGD